MKYTISTRGDGIGCCIFNLLMASLYSDITGRKLYIDWRNSPYSLDKNQNIFDIYFDFKRDYSLHIINKSKNVLLTTYQGLALYSDQHINNNNSFERGLYPSYLINKYYDVDIPIWKTDYNHTQDNDVFYEYLSKYLNNNLQFKSFLIDKVNDFDNIYNIKDYLGIHIRYGCKSLNKTVKGQYLTVINKSKKYISKHNIKKIFLCTDHHLIFDLFKKHNEDIEILAYPRIVGANYYSQETELLKNNNNLQKDILLIEAVTEIILLSRCYHFIGSNNSMFSLIVNMLWRSLNE